MSDADVSSRFVVIEERKRRIIESKLRAQQREEKRQLSDELVARMAHARVQKRMEQQGELRITTCRLDSLVNGSSICSKLTSLNVYTVKELETYLSSLLW